MDCLMNSSVPCIAWGLVASVQLTRKSALDQGTEERTHVLGQQLRLFIAAMAAAGHLCPASQARVLKS